MKKVALVFVLAVIVPSLLLAWLAVRSLRDQQFVSERQQSLLYQSVADALAKEAVGFLAERQREFNQQVETLLAGSAPRDAANSFDERLRQAWPWAEIGFVVSLEGSVLAPSLFASPEARKFRLENDRFLCSRETVDVYWNSPKGQINLTKLDQEKKLARADSEKSGPPGDKENEIDGDGKAVFATKSGKVPRAVTPQKDSPQEATSKVSAEETEFRQLVGDATEGTLARFLQNKLKVLIWHRSQRDPQLVFGAQLDLRRFVEGLRNLVKVDSALAGEICVALLDDAGKPLALSRPSFVANWKHPFVATEIGEVLPHWEMAVYLLNPAQVTQTVRAARLTLGLMIALLVLAIGVGSWLIVADLQRQLALARQKTDFVSNVSHELKTPLTSIRMFSELLAEGRVKEESKQRHYLHIITAEAARLTRLINNVLDFARLERGEKKYDFQKIDLTAIAGETVEAYRPHLEGNGFVLNYKTSELGAWVNGDRDALSQVLVNLISNAEKYCGDKKEVRVEVQQHGNEIEVKVLDRGVGVPRGCEEKIFEQFYRAHDSLASGIQGSGLGLTLVRQIARTHGGEVVYAPREGGGSCFSLKLPLAGN
jgi:signal transduction histidine kinase